MRNLKRRFERFTAIALAVLMVVTTVDLSTFAVSAAGEGSGTHCEHHTEHTLECGYTEGIEGSPCTHEHGEECYSEVTVCVHGHDESCGYVEGVEDSCTHICSLENGCIISALNCTHEHDEACGYQAAVEGTPCIFECEECATVCTCETDDPTYHAPFCDLYELPENPQCFCVEKCTEDSVNEWCDVCYGVGVEGCEGEAPLLSENVMATYASASTPILEDRRVYANGTPITIEAGSSSSTASVWYMNGSTKTYVAQDVENAVIYGGSYGESLDSDTNITMTSGSVYAIYGGGYDKDDASKGYVNNVNISISGGTVSYGVFASNQNWVRGNVNITVTGGNISRVRGCTASSQSGAGGNQEYCRVDGSASVTITGGTVGTLKIGDGLSPVNGTKSGIVTISGVRLETNSGFTATNDYDNLYISDGTTFVVKGDVTLPENTKLIIPSGKTFTLNGSTTIEAPYGIENNGTLNIEPGWTTSSNIENNGTLNISTLYTNSEGIVNNGTINLTKPILGGKPTGNGTINRNTAYISGISSVSSISVKMDDADYALANGYYETADGKLYLWLPSGYAVVFVDGSVYCGMATEGTAVELLAYKAVSDIETIPSLFSAGIIYNLAGYAVTNNDATYKTIEWSVLNANGTGATITDNAIKATSEGTATIRATVRNGRAYGEDYYKDYTITFYETDEISVANGSITISKKDENTVTITGGGLAEAKEYSMGEYITIIGTTDSNTITISEGTTANVILSNVSISSSNTPIDIQSGATLNLTLLGENTLTSNTSENAAFHVPTGAKIVITDESTGSLNATGGYQAAGIGGNYEENSGDVEIHGGTITAKCLYRLWYSGGAGIGGGYGGSNGSVTITGGYVNASAASGGAGIGAGYGWSRNGGKVTITGGTVIANGVGQSTYHGAGIGGGHNNGDGGNVVITGGNVQAIAGNGAEAIGKGNGSGSSGTLKDSAGNDISLIEITLDGVSDKTSVTNIVIDGSTYGSKDVVTIGDKLYLYLPADTMPTSVTAGGNTYICNADGTFYQEHNWVDATCFSPKHCTQCEITEGIAHSHNYVNGVCTVCGMDENGVFHIKTAEQLVAFAQYVKVGNKDANAELEADIDMTGVAWTPICQTVSFHDTAATDTGYSGTFDGNGHTISNLTVTGKSGATYSYGLFGTVSGTVENLGMVNYTYTMGAAGDTRAGSIAGQVLTGGTITNCYSVGHSITTNSNIAGGIAGCNYGGTISNCYALNGSVSGYDTRWGGVVGDCKKDDVAPDQAQTYGAVSNCYTDDTRVVSTQNDSGSITYCAVKNDAAFTSGEVAYLLNGSSSGNVTWYQTLETDTYPVLDSEHDKVYSVFKCNGTEQIYRNVNENEPHTDNNSDGVCDVCGGNAHIHEWTYTASNNTITAECGAADCPLNGAAKTIVISASDKTYDGTAVTATVTNNADTTDYSSSIVYKDSEGDVVDEAVNAGTYTANLTVGGKTATVEFTIAKVTPDIGTVSASNMENTLDVSQVVLSRSNETVSGTLSLAEGITLQYGTKDYTYVFTPNDNTNYETVTGTVSITITDTIAPTATYKVGTEGLKQFINIITFGHFCKDYTTVDITYSDVGSGVADKQYYISNEEITNTENIQWSEYTDTLNINATGKYYIYIRVTDNYGNVVIQNSEGIVVYAESVITPTSFSCKYGEENDLSVNISTNGNTFANLTDGSGSEIATDNYSIDGSTLTIKGEYLSDLDVGEYTYKICMNPQGVENTEVTLAYSFVVNVTAKELTVTGATAASRDYIANDKTVDITGVTLSGKQGTDDVSVEITGLKGTLSSANAGTYTSVTLPTLTLTGDDAENYVLVQPTSAVATNVTINKLNPTITVGETEYYKTFGDADFTLDITDDNPEANVTYSSNDENVVTVANGTVTIKGAGSATITVSMGASTNYNAAVDKTVTVHVARAAYSVDTINKNYLYARSNADSINLAELLPEDCGTVYYASVTYNGVLRFTSEDTKPKVTNGILAYTLESGAADDRGNIVVVVETQNYEDITITVNVTLIDKIPVNVDGEVELNSNILTYGETLSGLTFKSVDFVDNAGNEVAGTLAWKEPSATPNAGTTSATWVFTPNNAAYASVEGMVAITVNKATPNVTGVPTVADRVYNPSVVLADSDLTDGTVKGVDGNSLAGSWSWKVSGTVPVVNNSGYEAVFTPVDANYETVTGTIMVTVTKATPYVATKPTASALTYGQTLNQSVLSNGVIHYSETDSTVVAGSFAWEAGTVKPAVSDSATTLYNVLFTPDDSDNYKEVTVKLTVSVSKAEATALNNANKTYVYAESKNGESVSIEGLPEDCGSVSYEISSISDTNNMLENVSVDATGKLTYDVKSLNAYSNGLSATVTVTVSMQNYEDLTYTLTVVRTDKLVQNISAENISLTFGDNDTDIVVTGNKTELSYRVVDDSNENGDVVTVDSTGKVHIVNSGTAIVEIKAEGSSSYSEAICEIQVTVAKRTVNVPAKDDTVYTYTGLPQTYSIASSPFYTIENTTQTNAGTYDVAVSLISDNYQWSAVLPEYKFVIKPAQVTITAESHTVKQGDELPAFTYITTGLVNGENLPITVSVTCSATNSETVGTYDIVVSGPANEGNYTYTYKKGTLEVLAEDNAPFIKGDDGKMGWDAIRAAIEAANKGDTIVVDMNGATVVPGDIIELVRDKGVIISFEFDNGLTWTIDGSTVSDGEIGNINFDTTVEDENNSLNNIPIDVINNITGEKGTIEIYLVHSGEFGFTAVLKANLGSDNAGYYANLYYYNPTTGKLEYMCADVIASNGEAELTFTHASDYLIVIDDEDLGKAPDDDDDDDDGDDNGGGNNNNNNTSDTGNTKKEDEKDEVPDTGDAGTLYLWIMMVCAALGMAGVACYERLQKRNKK